MTKSLPRACARASVVAGLVLTCACVPAIAALAPATFDEYVGIGGYTAIGADTHEAESLSLTVLPSEWDNRGGGTGHAWIDPVDPVSAGVDLDLVGGSNPSGIGATASISIRYEFTVVALAPQAPAVVDLLFSGLSSIQVGSNQPVGHSLGRITVWGYRQFEVKNYDAYGSYTGSFEERWDRVPLGSFAVGATGRIDVSANSHGQGFGPDYVFGSEVFIDPTIEIAGPDSGSYRIDYSDGIVRAVPEPGALWLWLAALPLVLHRPRRKRAGGGCAPDASSRCLTHAPSRRTECRSSCRWIFLA